MVGSIRAGEPSRTRTWLLPVASTFAAASFAVLAGVAAGPGCFLSPCNGDFDCIGAGFCEQSSGRCVQECFTDEECQNPPSCRDDPAGCRQPQLRCTPQGRCEGNRSPPETGSSIPPPPPPIASVEGWLAPPGTGYVYVVERLALAPEDRGFDIDRAPCGGVRCEDNLLGKIGPIANRQIGQGVVSGESLILLELAGLDDDPYTGNDRSLTLKLYAAEDADLNPLNNFTIPPGQDRCCEFTIKASSLDQPDFRARSKSPGELVDGRFRSFVPVDMELSLRLGARPTNLDFKQVLFQGALSRDLRSLSGGLFGGAMPASTLARIDNPYCRNGGPGCPFSSPADTLLGLVLHILDEQPDIDLDDDGQECLLDIDADGRVDRCCDGRGPGVACAEGNTTCPGFEIPALDPSRIISCAETARLKDGFSFALEFSATSAKIIATN